MTPRADGVRLVRAEVEDPLISLDDLPSPGDLADLNSLGRDGDAVFQHGHGLGPELLGEFDKARGVEVKGRVRRGVNGTVRAHLERAGDKCRPESLTFRCFQIVLMSGDHQDLAGSNVQVGNSHLVYRRAWLVLAHGLRRQHAVEGQPGVFGESSLGGDAHVGQNGQSVVGVQRVKGDRHVGPGRECSPQSEEIGNSLGGPGPDLCHRQEGGHRVLKNLVRRYPWAASVDHPYAIGVSSLGRERVGGTVQAQAVLDVQEITSLRQRAVPIEGCPDNVEC